MKMEGIYLGTFLVLMGGYATAAFLYSIEKARLDVTQVAEESRFIVAIKSKFNGIW